MPGSISTGIAPTLNSANVSEKKSIDGGTISAARVPRVIPAFTKPWAIRSESVLISAKVSVVYWLGPSYFTAPRGTWIAARVGSAAARRTR